MDQKVRTMPIAWNAKGLGFTEPGSDELGLVVPATPFVWVPGGRDAPGEAFQAHIPADLARGVAAALWSGKIVRFVLADVRKEIAVDRFDIAEPAEGEALARLSFTGRFIGEEAAALHENSSVNSAIARAIHENQVTERRAMERKFDKRIYDIRTDLEDQANVLDMMSMVLGESLEAFGMSRAGAAGLSTLLYDQARKLRATSEAVHALQ